MGALKRFAQSTKSPKFYGAGFGALGGINIGAIVVGLIQTDILHHALSLPWVTLIESVSAPLFALIASYLAPLLPGLKVADVAANVPAAGSTPPTGATPA